ncbi:hypothetical protein INR49_022572 [Caranx melampygus]|nr:hypothetical protein INR49_022572 [Caranx melampygus]
MEESSDPPARRLSELRDSQLEEREEVLPPSPPMRSDSLELGADSSLKSSRRDYNVAAAAAAAAAIVLLEEKNHHRHTEE